MADWWVYMVECRGGYLYTGISTDVKLRFQQHQRGKGAHFMRLHPAEKIRAALCLGSRSAASCLEYSLKQQPKAKKLQWIASYPWASVEAPEAEL